MHSNYYELQVYIPSKSLVETLTVNIMALGGRAFGRSLGFDEVMRVDWGSCKNEKETSTLSQPGEDVVRGLLPLS